VFLPFEQWRYKFIQELAADIRKDRAEEKFKGIGALAYHPATKRFFRTGVFCWIEEMSGNTAKIVPVYRFKLLKFLRTNPYIEAEVRIEADTNVPQSRLLKQKSSLGGTLWDVYRSILDFLRKVTDDLPGDEELAEYSVGKLADFLATYIPPEVIMARKDILETKDSLNRFNKSLFYLNKFLDPSRVNVKAGAEGKNEDVDTFRNRFDKIKDKISNSLSEEIEKEIKRLQRTRRDSSEYEVRYNWLEFALEFYSLEATKDNPDLNEVWRILDADHYGLGKIKERVYEELVVRKLNPKKKGPSLCLVGPPGVGKTSLGQSIARALGRKFVRVSLGGLRDEAEIRGHRRTYVGSTTGKILRYILRSGSSNPVFMRDYQFLYFRVRSQES